MPAKLWKGQTEWLELQLSRKAIPADGPYTDKAPGLSFSSVHTREELAEYNWCNAHIPVVAKFDHL